MLMAKATYTNASRGTTKRAGGVHERPFKGHARSVLGAIGSFLEPVG